MVYDFSGPDPNVGPEWNSVSGPESGPESNNFSRPGALGCACFSRGSLEATVSICTFVSTSHLFEARMVYDFSGAESGTRMEQLFGARIGARIEQLFGAWGSWLWMFLQGLFGGLRFNLHICVHQPSFRGPNGMTFLGPEPSARMERFFEARMGSFFLWCLNTLCKLDFFVFRGSKA